MNQGLLAVVAVAGALAAVFLAVLAALATYDAVSGSDMVDDMGGMMEEMGGMMDDGMGGMMDGMMGGPETTGSASGRGTVRIENFRFEPTVLNVTRGTVVKWMNEDGAPHTATADDDRFDTGRLDRGESGETSFDTPGTYEYKCDFHPSMQGRIIVLNAGP
ncbi:MAG: cupredoxin domain-containing protein [Thermoanaerobaculia bacterium]